MTKLKNKIGVYGNEFHTNDILESIQQRTSIVEALTEFIAIRTVR